MLTIEEIKEEMDADGSYWWSKRTTEALGTIVYPTVYDGGNGILYFVTEETSATGGKFFVRGYDTLLKTIITAYDFVNSHAEADMLAKEFMPSVQ